MLTWRSSLPFTHERIGAAAIYCSDGRYNEQFDEFLHEQLGLPRYDRLTIPGGAAALAGHFTAYREEEALLEQLRFLIVAHELERIVLIAHKGCGFYLKKLHIAEERLRTAQETDLRKAAGAIRILNAGLRIEAFVAGINGDTVEIEPVPLV